MFLVPEKNRQVLEFSLKEPKKSVFGFQFLDTGLLYCTNSTLCTGKLIGWMHLSESPVQCALLLFFIFSVTVKFGVSGGKTVIIA